MTRHQRNATASTVYTYHEREKDQRESGYGTLAERLTKDAVKDFDCCSLTLQPCREPVVRYMLDYLEEKTVVQFTIYKFLQM